MKYVKVLSLMAVAVAAFTAFAASASATTLTSPTGTTYTGKIKATSTHVVLHGAFTSVTCEHSLVEGTVETHGKGVTVSGNISELDFTKCNFPTTVVKKGRLEVHAIKSNGETCTEGEGDKCTGTMTSSESEVSIATSVGTCIFKTNATDIGYLTTTNNTGGNAVLDIHGNIPRTGGNFLCGTSGTWTGTYTVNTPSTLWIDEN